MNITTPTPIQDLSIPPILEGFDVIAESATGSGKTLAFGCGVVEHVDPAGGLQALILTPTRELAEQVRTVLGKLAHGNKLKVVSIYGGVSHGPQEEDLSRAHVVVATPGRLLDHIERRTVDLSHVHLLILDEADRMLDMGFIDDVERIIRACPEERQTLFFSATLGTEIKSLSRKYMVEPVEVKVNNQVDPSKLHQVYYPVPHSLKLSLLVHLLKQEQAGLVMVFCNTRRAVDVVVKNLHTQKFDATAIHGGFSQNKRSKTINMFNTGRVSVLVCTDVAARGLHIDNVSHVYNYDIPNDSKDYVHRIGRTARAGADGKVVNLLCERDHENFSRILWDYKFNIEKLDKGYIEQIPIVSASDGRRGPRSFGAPHRGGRSGFGLRREGARSPRGPGFQRDRGQGVRKEGGRAYGLRREGGNAYGLRKES